MPKEGARISISLTNTRILSEEEINLVRKKFVEDTDFVYEDAINRHVSA